MLRFAFGCLFVMLLAGPTRAQQPDTDAYRELVRAAIAAQESGRYVDAYDLFAKAHALQPNARALRGMGVAAFQAGDYVQAILDLEAALTHRDKVLDEGLRHAVTELLARARTFVGSYTLKLTPADARVSVDGRPASGTPDLVLAPGRHTIEISAEGFASQTIAVSVQSGTYEVLQVPLEPAPPPGPDPSEVPRTATSDARAAAKPAPVALGRDGPSHRERRSRRAMWGLLGSGACLTVAATAMAVIGLVRAKPIDDACKAGCTEAYRERRIDQANLDGLSIGVDIAAGTALATLMASTGVWIWRRSTVKVNAEQHALRFEATLHF